LPSAARASIGKEPRFSSTFAGMFIRAEAASELQCRDSPGPLYSPNFSNKPRAPTANWGRKPTEAEAERQRRQKRLADLEIGPAAYQPNVDAVHRTPARVKFSRSHRFDSFGGHAYLINNSPWTTEGGSYEVKDDYVRPRTAAYTFSGGHSSPPKAGDPSARSRPRTSFLTSSIRGGFARPATLECGVGPGDYNTDQFSIRNTLARPSTSKTKFGTAPRFTRPGLVFHSAEHAKADGNVFSPGPKYSTNVGTVGTVKQRQSTGGLHWVP